LQHNSRNRRLDLRLWWPRWRFEHTLLLLFLLLLLWWLRCCCRCWRDAACYVIATKNKTKKEGHFTKPQAKKHTHVRRVDGFGIDGDGSSGPGYRSRWRWWHRCGP
jgi:hypothetical protein